MFKYYLNLLKFHKLSLALIVGVTSGIFLAWLDHRNIFTTLIPGDGRISLFVSWLVVALVIIILVIFGIEQKIYKGFIVPMPNIVDFLLISSLIASLIYLLLAVISNETDKIRYIVNIILSWEYSYKQVIAVAAISLTAIIITYRIIQNIIYGYKSSKDRYNLIDLDKLYRGEVMPQVDGKGIIYQLEEKDVDYDILGRDVIINQLTRVIEDIEPQNGYVISLEGPWGSGKSTILNVVKNKIDGKTTKINIKNNKLKQDIKFINHLDPWSYSDERALFRSILRTILQEIGHPVNSLQADRLIESFARAILGSDRATLISHFAPKNTANDLRETINRHINLTNKKYVVIFDNIDRSDSKQIYLLFRLVANVLNFDSLIYILSFDNNIVKKAFEDHTNLDYSYIKKIIQLPIQVPKPDTTALKRIYRISMIKLMELYNYDVDEVDKYGILISQMIFDGLDVRDFKRFMNSLSLRVAPADDKLNYIKRLHIGDLMKLEYIKLTNLKLYEEIYLNRLYFVNFESEDSYREVLNIIRLEEKEFKEYAKAYMDVLFKKTTNSKYLNLLAEMFPIITNYKKVETYRDIMRENHSTSILSRHNRVSNYRYIDLYFTEYDDVYSLLMDEVSRFIEAINKEDFEKDNNEYLGDYLSELIRKVDKKHHLDLLESLYLMSKEIRTDEKKLNLAKEIYSQIHTISRFRHKTILDAQSKARATISDLIYDLPNTKFQEFVESCASQYDKIGMLADISFGLESILEDHPSINGKRNTQEFASFIIKMRKDVIENKINLYAEPHYIPQNIWGLIDYLETEDDTYVEGLENYLDEIITKDTIYRALADTTSEMLGEYHGYFIDEAKLKQLNNNNNRIDKLLLMKTGEENQPDVKILMNIYNAYIEYNKNKDRENLKEHYKNKYPLNRAIVPYDELDLKL